MLNSVIDYFGKQRTIQRVTQTIVGYKEVDTFEDISVIASIQPIKGKDLLTIANYDSSKKYVTINSKSELIKKDEFMYNGTLYRVVMVDAYQEMSEHYSCTGEEIL